MNELAWNLDSEYPGLNSAEFQKDFGQMDFFLKQLTDGAGATVKSLQNYLRWEIKNFPTIHDIHAYLSCLISVDSKNDHALQLMSKFEIIHSKILQETKAAELKIQTLTAVEYAQLFAPADLEKARFKYDLLRERSAFILNEQEEKLILSLSLPGFQAWGNLYRRLSGTLNCQVTVDGQLKTLGLSEAHSLLRSDNSDHRESAWRGIIQSWTEHQESAAGILNALAGWRLEVNSVRAKAAKKPMHFLDESLAGNHMQPETLFAMNKAIENNLPRIQKGLFAVAKALGQKQLHPWDLLAPPPPVLDAKPLPIETALQYIREAFAQISPKFGEFIDLAVQNGWIESRVLSDKQTGAYCTHFLKTKTPRVFISYMGSNQDLSTLAHELGHAFHYWTMRDMDLGEQEYPSTLAETASIFTETLLRDSLLDQDIPEREKYSSLWGDVQGAASLLVNIPARFEFESKLYERRSERTLSAAELCELSNQAWKKWYGPTLSENDTYFWAHKQHFAMTWTGFYNYPYAFGYLFGLSVYARRKTLGAKFAQTYVDILRDTGRMKAEALIQKHLGEDITQVSFWQKSIDLVIQQIEKFESMTAAGHSQTRPVDSSPSL